MKLSYGGFAHQDNECEVVIRAEPMRDEAQQYYQFRDTWEIRGFVQATDQAGVIAACTALENAYARDGGDLILLANTPPGGIAAQMLSGVCIGGTRVIRGPVYPEGGGAQFSNFRTYEITVEGIRPATVPVELLAWHETLAYKGTGGPELAYPEPLTGLPQKQQVKQATTCYCTQTGFAVGFTDWPDPAPPIFPGDEDPKERELIPELPKRYGPPGKAEYREFKVNWKYVFRRIGPFPVTHPTKWPA